jgi:hypothetical protein
MVTVNWSVRSEALKGSSRILVDPLKYENDQIRGRFCIFELI